MSDYCPSCGEEIAMTAVTGPTEAFAVPCGCEFPPDLLDQEEEPDA